MDEQWVNKARGVHWVLVTRAGIDRICLCWWAAVRAEGQSPAVMRQVMSMSWCWLPGSCSPKRSQSDIHSLKSIYTFIKKYIYIHAQRKKKCTERCFASCRHGISYRHLQSLWVCMRYMPVKKSQTYSFPIYVFFFLGVLICLPSSKIDGWTLSQRETRSLWKRCQREKLKRCHTVLVSELEWKLSPDIFMIACSSLSSKACSSVQRKKIIFVPSSSWELTHTLKHSCCSLVGVFRCGDTLGCNRL